MTPHIDQGQDSAGFPVRLLALGYGTALVAALALYLLGSGMLAAALTFWLGGAVATLLWGAISVYAGRTVRLRARGFASLFRLPASAK